MLSVRLRVEGTDAQGIPFKEDARTVPFSINRHGAHIRVANPLESGQILRLVHLVTNRQADFRLVGPVSPFKDEEGGVYGVFGPIPLERSSSRGYGVECLDTEERFWDFWRIRFPATEERALRSKDLLECRTCHRTSLLPISLIDVDVLETAGLLSWPCETCKMTTPWGYAEALPRQETQPNAPANDLKFRKPRRVPLQFPLLIRKYSGEVEITQSENVSKGGLRFVSEKHYYAGEGVLVACPYHARGENIEVRAFIVYQQPMEGTPRKVYGVRFASPQSR